MSNDGLQDNKGLFELDWFVHEAGYKIVLASSPLPDQQVTKGRLWGTDGLQYYDEIVPNREGPKKIYNPFKDQLGIAKEFSLIPINTEKKMVDYQAAKKFADRYGILGIEYPDLDRPERLQDWYSYVFSFWEIYALLDLGFYGHAQMMYNNFGPAPKLEVSIVNSKKKWQRFLEIRPTNLLGAMWLMLANDIGKGCNLQLCEKVGCGVWFQKRSNRKYCSNACKVAHFRQVKLGSI